MVRFFHGNVGRFSLQLGGEGLYQADIFWDSFTWSKDLVGSPMVPIRTLDSKWFKHPYPRLIRVWLIYAFILSNGRSVTLWIITPSDLSQPIIGHPMMASKTNLNLDSSKFEKNCCCEEFGIHRNDRSDVNVPCMKTKNSRSDNATNSKQQQQQQH